MKVSYLNFGLRSLAIFSITGYQKYISPYKRFSCASRILYGGESCSQYIKNVIAKHTLVTAIQLSRQRFKACRDAYKILDRQSLNDPSASLDGCDLGCHDLEGFECCFDFIDERWFEKKQQE